MCIRDSYSTATYIRFNVTKKDGKPLVELVINRNLGEETVAEAEIEQSEIYLRVVTHMPVSYTHLLPA